MENKSQIIDKIFTEYQSKHSFLKNASGQEISVIKCIAFELLHELTKDLKEVHETLGSSEEEYETVIQELISKI